MGVEVCAALKNAYAMGIAFAAGLHERAGGQPGSVAMHNYESAVFAQSVLEMQRLVAIAGGDPATAAGLAGVGDLDVTCNGGPNRTFRAAARARARLIRRRSPRWRARRSNAWRSSKSCARALPVLEREG